MMSFSGVTFVFVFFIFVFMLILSLKPWPFDQSSFDMQAPRQPHVFLFIFLEMSLFPSIVCTIFAFYLYAEYVVRSFLPNGVFFYLVTTGSGIFYISLCENSIQFNSIHMFGVTS